MAALVGRGERGALLGVAIAPNAVCASLAQPGHARAEAWRMSIASLNGDGTSWPALTDALRALARDAGIVNGRLTVALLPPLAEARGVDLPPLSDAELQQLLARGAGKYFVGARGIQVVGAVRVPTTRGQDTVSTVAAAAPARLVNAIYEAANAAGWTVESVIPAEAAWAAAAARWTGRGRSSAQLLVAHADRTDLLRVEHGRLVGLRRFRAGTADADLIAGAFSSRGGPLIIVGPNLVRKELSRSLGVHGVSAEAPSAAAEIAEQPDLLAAAFATPDAAPALVSDAVRAARAYHVRRVATRLAIAAGVLLVASGALAFWGARRELTSIKAQRKVIAPQIASTLVGRTTVEVAFRQLQALVAEERAAPHWSSAIAALSDRLPEDAFLTGFRGRGDSVSVEGLAEHAARVFDAIAAEPTLHGVHSAGPVRIENATDGPPMERYTIAAQIVRPGTKAPPERAGARATPAPASKGGAR